MRTVRRALTNIAATACLVSPAAGQAAAEQALLVIGELDAPTTHVFGSVTAVAVGSRGDVFILDGMNAELRWFDADGSFRDAAGREGGGPGEFRVAAALELDGDGVLSVLDPGNLKISRFRAGADGLEHVDDQRIGPAFDFCIAGDRRLILHPTGNGIIHELDAGGGVLRSFGSPMTSSEGSSVLPADLRMELLNRGDLDCDSDRNRVVLASERSGRVAAYDLSGRLVWRTELAGFKPVRWVSVGGGRFQMAGDPATGVASTVRTIMVDARGDVLVTVHEGSVEDPDGRLVTVTLDGATGRELRTAPASAAWVRSQAGALFGIQRRPYPRVIKVAANQADRSRPE